MDRIPYAGVGKRDTPNEWLYFFKRAGAYFETKNFHLRSGRAVGADAAWENRVKHKSIWTVVKKPDGYSIASIEGRVRADRVADALRMAEEHHPEWDKIKSSEYVKLLMARNCFQVLGEDLESPSRFVACWTPLGSVMGTDPDDGGTGQAIRVANSYLIPVINVFGMEIGQAATYLKLQHTGVVREFRGYFEFLSNFYPAPIRYKGVDFPDTETAYQWEKVSLQDKSKILKAGTPGRAKRMAKGLMQDPSFHHRKLEVMKELTEIKYSTHRELRRLLLCTAGVKLQEGNQHKDSYWGIYNGEGENHLGKILMEVRDSFMRRGTRT